jgi:hypothetical protein
MKIFEGIHDMWLYNYDMYCKTLDYNWFRTDYTGKESKLEEVLIYPHAMKIIDEYYLRLNNQSYKINIQTLAKINGLQTKFYSINSLLDILAIGFDLGEMKDRLLTIKELNFYGFKFPEFGSHQEDLENVVLCRNQANAIKNEIIKLKESLKKESTDAVKEISRVLKEIKIALNIVENINVKNTTLLDFIEYCEILNDK